METKSPRHGRHIAVVAFLQNRVFQALSIFGILAAYVWLTILAPFFSNGMPTGWDTAAYLAWANSLRIAGIGYVQSPSFYQYAGLNVIPGLLLYAVLPVSSSNVVDYLVFQIIILMIFFISTIFLSRQFRRSFPYTLLVIAILVTSFAFIRMTRDLYGNLLSMAFLQFSLGQVVVLRKGQNWLASIGLFVTTSLMFFTDVEVGGFGTLVLLGVVLLSLRQGTQLSSIKRTVLPIVLSVGVALALWSSLAIDYLSVSTLITGTGGTPDWQTITLSLGGYALIPLWAGVLIVTFVRLRKDPKRFDLTILGGWSAAFAISSAILLLFRPGLAFRVALLLPICFLLAESIWIAWDLTQLSKRMSGFARPVSLIVLLSIGVLVTVSSASTFVMQTTPAQTSPFLPSSDYAKLTKLATYLKSNGMSGSDTLFLIYPQARINSPAVVSAWTNMYDNWIWATVGPHLSYYGTLGNLTLHLPMQFVSSDEEDTYRLYKQILTTSSLPPSVNIVMVDFLYSGRETSFSDLSNPLSGVYLSHWNESDRSAPAWMSAAYALNQTGGYFKQASWSLSGIVLESYQARPANSSNNFQGSFSIYAPETAAYSIDVRMFDYNPSNSPIVVQIDGTDLFAFNYYGSQSPRVFSGEIGTLSKGYHLLTVHTLAGFPHNLDLDSIRLSSASVSSQTSVTQLPNNWSIDDGAGTIQSGLANSTVVAGSPDNGGLLGVIISFSTAVDLSGSRFIDFTFNGSVTGIVSIWLNDSSGNMVRYDFTYGMANQSQHIIIPVVPFGFGFTSPGLPLFSSIQSLELGITTLDRIQFTYDFTNPVLVVDPIPLQYV